MEGFCHTTHTTHTRAIEIEYPHIIIYLDIDIYYRNIDIAHIGWISYRSKGVESIIWHDRSIYILSLLYLQYHIYDGLIFLDLDFHLGLPLLIGLYAHCF